MLNAGTKLGHYEIQALIGQGGMGEVYRATDAQLKRDVALKVLPEQFSRDPDRVARFRREAELLASLNHPNIAAIYGIYSKANRYCLAMELVEGETLREMLHQSRAREQAVGLSIEETVTIAKQICDALEHAHEKNIIHRDLKPANVKVTPEGTVKVLDFGLAKAFARESTAGDTASPVLNSNSPTLSHLPAGYQQQDFSPTIPGVILGTAAYMSPDQARGKTVDKRTDIWALGCVLYELLTGKQAFAGEDVSDILASVLKSEPDWSRLPADTPPGIRALLRRCLTKDPNHRLRSAADISIALEDALTAPAYAPPATPAPVHPPWRRVLPWAVTAALCLVVGLAVWNLRPMPSPQPVTRLTVNLPPTERLGALSTAGLALSVIALSPDGRDLVYTANQQLYLRSMGSLEARPIPGTEGAVSPFFSPDGQWAGFFAAGELKKVSISGAAALPLCDVANPGSASANWGTDDIIIFGSLGSGLLQVSAAGGTPQELTTLKGGETGHGFPQSLPGGKAVLFTNFTSARLTGRTEVLVMETGERKVLIEDGYDAYYVPTGHLIYSRAETPGTLLAVPFDLARLEVTGAPVPVVDSVLQTVGFQAQFNLSHQGTLAYVPGGTGGLENAIVWVDRKGVEEPLKAPPRPYGGNSGTRLSPDGQQVAIQIGSDLWIYNVPRNTLTRLTFEGTNLTPAWTRDGKRVVYTSTKGGVQSLVWKSADGGGAEEVLVSSKNALFPGSFTPDGRTFVYSENRPTTGRDILILPLDGDRKPQVFLKTQFNETTARLSPDGRFVAYVSDESGRNEVYIQPFPGPGGKYQVSTEGGTEMVWAADGEIFYRSVTKMIAVEVQTQPTLKIGKPQVLFDGKFPLNVGVGANYDVTSDGQRFIMLKRTDQNPSGDRINVVLNWFEELKQKVPVQ